MKEKVIIADLFGRYDEVEEPDPTFSQLPTRTGEKVGVKWIDNKETIQIIIKVKE